MPPQYERGLYEPSDQVRVFDGSEEDEDSEGSRLPLLIVLALLVLAMFAGFVWLAYTQGVARGRSQTPVLTAQAGPARVAPQNPGGAEQPFKGFKIYEQPAPPDDGVAQDAPAAMTPAPVEAPQQVAKAEPVKPEPAKIEPAKVEPAPVVKPAPVAKVAAPPVAAKPAPVAKVTPPPVEAKPVAKVTPAPVAKPAPQVATAAPAPAAIKSEPIGPASGAPRSLPAPATAQKVESTQAPKVAALPPIAAAKPASSGSAVLQIGAYKSQADADAAWKAYAARHAALLAGYGPDVARADLGDKGVWYRLRVTGFASKDVASAVCDRLKADGGGCFPAQ